MNRDELRAAVGEIAADRVHGASVLVRQAALAFATARASGAGVVEAARALAEAQPAMAPILKLACELMANPDQAHMIARATLLRLDTAPGRIAEHVSKLVSPGSVPMTISMSSTVITVLRSIAPARLLVAESLPGGEGRLLADQLGERARLISDSEIYRAMADATVVICGADAITPTAVVNKVGTALLALAARASSKPVYVCCDTGKRVDRELVPGALFEAVPREWFSAIITEEGIESRREALPL